MDELEKNIMEFGDSINQNWVKEIQGAEKENRGIDLSNMMGLYSTEVKKMMQCIREFKQRMAKQKKGGFFK